MILYTAQFRYPFSDRLDITAATKDPLGKIFAPPWDLVKQFKDNQIDEKEYTNIFHNLMVKSYETNPLLWKEVLAKPICTLVCYCSYMSFCHRFLVAEYLKKLGADYLGERPDSHYKKKKLIADHT